MKLTAMPGLPSLQLRQQGPLLLALFAILIGMAVPAFVAAVGGSPAKALALPAVLLLVMLLIYSRVALLTGILLLRAFCDVFFDATRISLGATQIGLGFLVNVFVILIALLLVMEKPQLLPRKMFLFWLPFLLCGLIGVVMAHSVADALRAYLAQLSYCAMFVCAFYVVRTPEDFKKCVRIVLVSSVLPVIYGLIDIAVQGGVHGPNGPRLQSTFAHPNIYAFYLTLVISLGFYMLKSDSYKLTQGQRTGLGAWLVLLFAMLALTQTRSAWIACAAMFLGYGLLFERRYLVYMLVVPMLALLIPDVRDRVLDLGAGNEVKLYAKLNSFAWRLYIWESGLEWMRPSHYLLGYGLDSFAFNSPTFFPLAGKTHFGAHSMFVQWLFELGALGLLACLYVYGRVLWTLKQLAAYNKLGAFILIVMVVQYLIVSASDNMAAYLAFNWYFWFVLGSGCALLVHGVRAKEVA